nr:acyltransferase family protein [Micrococcus lylae]
MQGLRALAVGLVVLHHAVGRPAGGYVGVDVFFVISGFLITGNLLRDVSRAGRLDLVRFYAARARRILPAALVTAAVTVALAWLTWFRPQALQVTLDGLWSSLWVANWHFIATGTDYLAGDAAPSPFQHYWSLSVEEQFYAVWPPVLMLFILAGRRVRRARPLTVVLAGVALLAAAGLAWSVIMVAVRPAFAYFDPIGRSWELLVGAMVAVLAAQGLLHRPGSRAWSFQRWSLLVGLAVILLGSIVLTEDSAFPGAAALLPVVGCALVLVSRSDAVGAPLLTNRVATWLGDISYSLYLWHFPVFVFGHAWGLVDGLLSSVLAMAVSVLLAWASYHGVEQPFRRRSAARSLPARSVRASAMMGGAVAGVILLCTAVQFLPGRTMVIADRTTTVATVSTDQHFSTTANLSQALEQAATSPEPWTSSLSPSPDVLGQQQIAAPMRECSNTAGQTQLSACTVGQGPRQALLLGDSVALAWTPAVAEALGDAWTLTVVGVASCAPWDTPHGARWDDPAFPAACAQSREAVNDLVAEQSPDLVLASGAHGGYRLQPDGVDDQDAWRDGAAQAARRWQGSGAQVVLLGAPPLGEDPRQCVRRFGTTLDCLGLMDPDTDEVAEALDAGAAAADAAYVDVRGWFCTDRRQCPAAAGGLIIRTDPTHITSAFAEALAPLMAEKLDEALGTAAHTGKDTP